MTRDDAEDSCSLVVVPVAGAPAARRRVVRRVLPSMAQGFLLWQVRRLHDAAPCAALRRLDVGAVSLELLLALGNESCRRPAPPTPHPPPHSHTRPLRPSAAL